MKNSKLGSSTGTCCIRFATVNLSAAVGGTRGRSLALVKYGLLQLQHASFSRASLITNINHGEICLENIYQSPSFLTYHKAHFHAKFMAETVIRGATQSSEIIPKICLPVNDSGSAEVDFFTCLGKFCNGGWF